MFEKMLLKMRREQVSAVFVSFSIISASLHVHFPFSNSPLRIHGSLVDAFSSAKCVKQKCINGICEFRFISGLLPLRALPKIKVG